MEEKPQTGKYLVELDSYLKTGSHIGTKFKTGDMQRYIFKQRKDGLKVLDVETIDSRIRVVSGFLSTFDTAGVVVAARRAYGQQPAKMFAEIIGGRAVVGRFVPGTFTNPNAKEFFEPKVLVITDPEADRQSVEEATKLRIPVVAMCSTNNYLKNIDLAIPINNKGRKSLALVYFLLAREILKAKGLIKSDSDFDKKAEDFEYKLKEGAEEEGEDWGGESGQKRQKDRFDRKKPGDRDRGRRRSFDRF